MIGKPDYRTAPLILLGATLGALALAPATPAIGSETNVAVTGGKLSVTTQSVSTNITVSKQTQSYTVREQGGFAPLKAGQGCSNPDASPALVTCPNSSSTVQSIRVDLAELSGFNIVTIVGDTPSEMHGGDGVDILIGGAGTDKIYGGDGPDSLNSGAGGGDELYGEDGADEFEKPFGAATKQAFGLDPSVPFLGHKDGPARFDGGPGADQWMGFAAKVKAPGRAHLDVRPNVALPDGNGWVWGTVGVLGPDSDSTPEFADGSSGFETHYLRNIEAVRGTDGDDVFWGSGADENFYGNGGSDWFNSSPGSDLYFCGPDPTLDAGGTPGVPDGIDTVDHDSSTQKVAVTLDGQANDGKPGENDNIQNDCNEFKGGSGGLTVQGNDSSNTIEAHASGPIDVHGNGGNDVLTSSPHGTLYGDGDGDWLSEGEWMYGGAGDDVLLGGALLIGGPGGDWLVGGPGWNFFVEQPGEGTDIFLAGFQELGLPAGGGDIYMTKDGVRELVACVSPAFVSAVGPQTWGDANDDYRGCF